MKRVFTPAVPAATDEVQASQYRQQIARLAGPDPLAFSGRKLVLISTRESDSAAAQSLRKVAKSSVHFGMSADSLLASALKGTLHGDDAAQLQSLLAGVLGQADPQLWISDSGKLPRTAAAVSATPVQAGGAGPDQAAGGTAKVEKPDLDAVSVMVSDGADLRCVRSPEGGSPLFEEQRKALAELAAKYPDSTPAERLAHLAHPHALITSAGDAAGALGTIRMLKQNPWYRKDATIVALLETSRGTDLLTF